MTLAFAMGLFLPIAETVRRFHQLTDLTAFFSWFDDYILGGILLVSAWMVHKQRHNAVSYLIGAWGIGTGALFLSFLGQLHFAREESQDPGGVFSVMFVLIAKGIILGVMIVGLMRSIKAAGS